MIDYFDYKYGIITLYPTMAYVFYLFCKKYYNYLLKYNLLMADIYDNTYDNTNDNINDKATQTE